MTVPRVLVVEDDAAVAEAMALALRDHAEVMLVPSAGDAQALEARGVRFDLILCSLMLPLAAAIELYCELLRTAPNQAHAIVFLVGPGITSSARAFVDAIEAPCLEMPLDADELRDFVRDRRLSVYDPRPTGRWHH